MNSFFELMQILDRRQQLTTYSVIMLNAVVCLGEVLSLALIFLSFQIVLGLDSVKSLPTGIPTRFLSHMDNDQISLISILTVLGSALFTTYCSKKSHDCSHQVGEALSLKLISGLYKINPVYGYKASSSELIRIILEDINLKIVNGIHYAGVITIGRFSGVVVTIILLTIVDPVATSAAIIAVATLFVISYLIFRVPLRDINKVAHSTFVELAELTELNSSSLREIRLWNLTEFMYQRFQLMLSKASKASARINFLLVSPKPLVEGVLIVLVFVMSYLVKTMDTGTDSTAFIAKLGLFAVAGYRLIPHAQQIFASFSQVQTNRHQLVQLISTYRKMTPDSVRSTPLIQSFGQIQNVVVNNLTVELDSKKILDIPKLELEKNLSYLIVGHSGSGKTTLLNNLLGFGTGMGKHARIMAEIQGEKKRISIDAVASHWTLASHDCKVFQKSVAENICLDMASLNIQKIGLSMEAACVDFLEHGPNDTIDASNLSAGQRQRIIIARALYFLKDCLAFDEATGALDPETERKVIQNVLRIRPGLIVCVSHRVSLFDIFDRIIVMNTGKVEYCGPTNQALTHSPTFSSLLNLG